MRFVIGTGVDPFLAGFARGLLVAAAMGALGAIAKYLGGADVPVWLLPFVPTLAALIRAVEGLLDRSKLPHADS